MSGAALALAARVVLAVVLAFSAGTKLRSFAATRRITADLLGPRAGAVIALVLPGVELVVGVALVAWWTAVPGIVAFVLFVAFTAVLVRAQARRLPCPCFGATSGDTVVRPLAVVRNGWFAALAVLATASPEGASAGAAAVALTAVGVVTLAAVVASR